MLELCTLGTGGTLPLPDRALSSLYVRVNGRAMLMDCGEGTQVGIRRLGWGFKCLEALCTFFENEGRIPELDKTLTVLAAVVYKSAIDCCQPWEAPQMLAELIRIVRRYDISCRCSDAMMSLKNGSFSEAWLRESANRLVQGFRL